MFGNNSELDGKEKALVAWVCWYLWKGHCMAIFEGKEMNPSLTVMLAEGAWREFEIAKEINKSHSMGVEDLTVNGLGKWKLPIEGRLKISVDGAFKDEDGCAGFGIIIRNRKEVVDGVCGKVEASSSLEMLDHGGRCQSFGLSIFLGEDRLVVSPCKLGRPLGGQDCCKGRCARWFGHQCAAQRRLRLSQLSKLKGTKLEIKFFKKPNLE